MARRGEVVEWADIVCGGELTAIIDALARRREAVEYKGFRLAAVRQGRKYVWWVETQNGPVIAAGQVGTVQFDTAEAARQAARAAIDAGEVR